MKSNFIENNNINHNLRILRQIISILEEGIWLIF